MGLGRCSGQSSGFLLVHMGCGFTDLERLAAPRPSFGWKARDWETPPQRPWKMRGVNWQQHPPELKIPACPQAPPWPCVSYLQVGRHILLFLLLFGSIPPLLAVIPGSLQQLLCPQTATWHHSTTYPHCFCTLDQPGVRSEHVGLANSHGDLSGCRTELAGNPACSSAHILRPSLVCLHLPLH